MTLIVLPQKSLSLRQKLSAEMQSLQSLSSLLFASLDRVEFGLSLASCSAGAGLEGDVSRVPNLDVCATQVPNISLTILYFSVT